MAAIRAALAAGRGRNGLRVSDYSVQRDHLHLVVEADDTAALSRGMQGLAVRLARALNRAWGTRGRVFGDRFHARVLRSPREVRHALAYVLNNARKHAAQRGIALRRGWLDPCSSAPAFEGWRGLRPRREAAALGCAEPRSWLRRVGWARNGPLDPWATPSAG
jgi:REP element-mobilizing transposase RayT